VWFAQGSSCCASVFGSKLVSELQVPCVETRLEQLSLNFVFRQVLGVMLKSGLVIASFCLQGSLEATLRLLELPQHFSQAHRVTLFDSIQLSPLQSRDRCGSE